jgi:hypothetical protein
VLRAQVAFVLLAAACGDNAPARPDAATEQEVTVLRAVPNHELDLVFVIDDSLALDVQTNLKAKVSVLHDMLLSLDPPIYDVHIGVLSTDMGTTYSLDPTNPAPGIGSGPGSCSGLGKDGRLQTSGSTLINGVYLAEQLDTDGVVTSNYTTTFEQGLAAMMSLGASGCGFEQPFRSLARSFTNPANAGFIRDTANLAVILFLEEDDCSVRDGYFFGNDTTTLGTLSSFRCTRWGLQCNEDVNTFGIKTGCHPWQDSPYIDDVTPLIDGLVAFKADPRKLAITGIIGNPEPIEVEARTPPGGGSAIPALAHSCMYNGAIGPQAADPGKRLEYFLDNFPSGTHTALTSICDQDLAPALRIVTTAIKKTLGDTCIDTRSLLDIDESAPGIQPRCTAVDIRDSDPTPIEVPFELVVDERICPLYPEHLRFVPHRTADPAADAWTHVRCTLAR